MTIVKLLDDLTAWAQQNICSKIQLKVPPSNADAADAGYEFKTANPVAFTMYVPAEDKLPQGVESSFPSLCVRFLEGVDDMAAKNSTIGIQFVLSVWNPGTHGEDTFQRNADGWRDVWNFADIVVHTLESLSSIAGYELDHAVPIKFGPLTEQESIPDFYPFWFAWVSFQLKYPLRRNTEDFQHFL